MTKINHVSYRVLDIEKSLNFYRNVLGMKLLKRKINETFSVYVLGFAEKLEDLGEEGTITLLRNHDQTEAYDLGEGYGHVAIGSPDIYKLAEEIKQAGGNVTREPGPVKGGKTEIAFVTDPDGYKIELIQRDPSEWKAKLLHCMLRVDDLEETQTFYEKAFGMKRLRCSDNEEYKYSLGFQGFEEEKKATVFEWTKNWDRKGYEKGNGYAYSGILVDDMDKATEMLKAANANILKTHDGEEGKPFTHVVMDCNGYKLLVSDKTYFMGPYISKYEDCPTD